jgi:hypothetical protein
VTSAALAVSPAAGTIVEHDREQGYDDTYVYSADHRYRWQFERRWSEGRTITWVGLNPGIGATDNAQRPTLRRMVTVSRASGYGGLIVVNLFGLRTRDPKDLRTARDPIGEANDDAIAFATSASVSDMTVACWGHYGGLHDRAQYVMDKVIEGDVYCLGITKGGEPRHPLYVPSDVKLMPYL